MQPTRRFLFAATAALIASPALAQAPAAPATTPPADPRMADRVVGSPTAKVTVEEWFSFTCSHCARFAADIYPEVKTKLIDTGKLRYVFREFPRDQTDLMAAMVARSLPVSRYEPFMLALLDSQARWAFNRSAEPKDELAKMAALAGMPRAMFDRAISDEGLKAALLAVQSDGEKKYNIDSTPTFIVNGKAHAGELTYDGFAKLVGV